MGLGVRRNKRGIIAECANADPVVAHLPFFYTLHLNVPCNQKCIMCAPGGNHEAGMVSFADFTAFFERIRGVAEHLTLIGGETFMYPGIEQVLDLLSQHEIAVTINTNATLLTEHITPRLLALHELHLKCSVDAATRATYHRVRGTDVFERVTANLHRFSAARAGHPKVHLILVYVVMRENLEDVVPFVEYARALDVARVEFHPVRHVTEWHVANDTGWVFDGREQSCEYFRDEYNAVMREAAARCESHGLRYEVELIP
jgi:MoaA/NifB/PqqE/SkfB family radical SAM enzyme